MTSSEPSRLRIESGPPLAWGLKPSERIQRSSSTVYIVQPGDTLWAIAAVHEVEVEDLANWNKIRNPDQLWVGQGLRLRVPEGVVKPPTPSQVRVVEAPPAPSQTQTVETPPESPPVTSAAPKTQKKETEEQPVLESWNLPETPPKIWLWPHKGHLVGSFGRHGARQNNGIDIEVNEGDPVVASADGIVAYADDSLPGYGRLILVRHGGSYTTAYAHNQKILVQRGQRVRAGETIALAGKSGATTTPKLHFELRYRIKPLNPIEHLSRPNK